ncbi:uncharacterized protein FFB14_15346 [Fusarium fujikuroi]|nr:uncharacterized protein FFB14_15346 [Fusarium fujikuroi]
MSLPITNLLTLPSPPQTPLAIAPPRQLLGIPEDLQEKIWRLTLPEFRMHRVFIEIQSSYDEWCEPEPGDRPGLEGLEPLYPERPIYRWRQTIESPQRPVGLNVCRDSRRIMLSFFRERPRRCIRQLVQNDEGQNRFLDIDASEGNSNVGLCNPETDMLFVDGSSAMFPLNLRALPVIGVSVQVEGVGGIGPSLACDHLSPIVAPHYTPLPVGRPVAWTGSAGRLEAQLIQNWEFLYHGHEDTRITTAEEIHDQDVTTLDENDADSNTMLVSSTIPMSCECPKMVEIMTRWAAAVAEEQMAECHPK